MNKIIKILDCISNNGKDWTRWILWGFLIVFIFRETGISTMILAVIVLVKVEADYIIRKKVNFVKEGIKNFKMENFKEE